MVLRPTARPTAPADPVDEGNLSYGFRIWISGARDRGLGTEAVELTLRDALLFDGTWVDAHVMGMLTADSAKRHGGS